MQSSRRQLMAGVAAACVGGTGVSAAAGPPVVDNGSDDRGRNVRIELRVVGEGSEPLADEPVVLRDPGGSLDIRRGRTGPKGGLVFVESVGPAPCNPLYLELPRHGREVDLGCHNGYTELRETVRVDDAPDRVTTGERVRVLTAVPEGAEQVWPVATDAARDYCRTAGGTEKPTTGEGAATWFEWAGCGDWKAYDVEPGVETYLQASTDSASLVDARFELEERVDGTWRQVYQHGDRLGDDGEAAFAFTPRGERIRVRNVGGLGFYLEVFRAPDGRPAGGGGETPESEPEPDPDPTSGNRDAEFSLPGGLGAAVWGAVLVLGGLLAGTQVAHRRSTPTVGEREQADEAWREMRTHPDVEETTWSGDDLPEYAVHVRDRRVVARRSSEQSGASVSLELPLSASRPGAGLELVGEGEDDRVELARSGPLAPELPEAVWRRVEGLRTVGRLTVDADTATVSHALDETGDPNALRSPDDLVAQATAVAAVADAVEDSVDDTGSDASGGDESDGGDRGT